MHKCVPSSEQPFWAKKPVFSKFWAGIIRNKLKVNTTITNAKAFLQIQQEFGTFDKYIWGFIDGNPIQNKFKSLKQIPAKTKLSDKISEDLKKRGFKFVGSTIVYAHMQATGMVNDHIITCFRYEEVINKISYHGLT